MKHTVQVVSHPYSVLGVRAVCTCGWSEQTKELRLSDEVWRRLRQHLMDTQETHA